TPAADSKPAAGAERDKEAAPAADTTASPSEKPPAEPGNDPAAMEKVPPSSKGGGCRIVGRRSPAAAGSFVFVLAGASLWRLRRRRAPVCPSPVASEEKEQVG